MVGIASIDGLGGRLRDRRKSLRRTLSQVARKADISISHLSAIESGKTVPSLGVLAKIARSLEVSIASILTQPGPAPIARGKLDLMVSGAHAVHHPGLRLSVVSLVAETDEDGESPVGTPQTLLVHVRTGSLDVLLDGEVYLITPEDTLHSTRPAVLRWRVRDGPSLSLWVGVPNQS